MDTNLLTGIDPQRLAAWKAAYQLPGNPATDIYVCPVSGGADSAALAILMHNLHPEINFRMIFTDTGAEDPELYTTLDRLEQYLGRKIERLDSGETLWSLIEKWGGFLPNSQARWCTSALKRVPFENWLKQFSGTQKHMFIGIRADESERIAFALTEAETWMPFIELGIVREEVFEILSKTIGIPKLYKRRTRSGCVCCPFQRRSELVGLLQESPIEFRRGAACEKLSATDAQRHAPAPDLTAETRLTRNWLNLPLPRAGEEIVGKHGVKGESIFGEQGIWIGAEIFYDVYPGYPPFSWHQRVVSYSPTFAGIKRQLNDRYAHLLATSEVYQMTPDDVRERVKFIVYFIEVPADLLDVAGPSEGSYTWGTGASYRMIEHLISWGTRVLNVAAMEEEARDGQRAHELSWTWEHGDGMRKALGRIKEDTGRLVRRGWFTPSEPVASDEIDEKTIPCPMCQV